MTRAIRGVLCGTSGRHFPGGAGAVHRFSCRCAPFECARYALLDAFHKLRSQWLVMCVFPWRSRGAPAGAVEKGCIDKAATPEEAAYGDHARTLWLRSRPVSRPPLTLTTGDELRLSSTYRASWTLLRWQEVFIVPFSDSQKVSRFYLPPAGYIC